AFFLRKRSVELPRFTELSYLVRFLAMAVVAAPAIIGLLFAGLAHAWARLDAGTQFRDWFATDALGIAVTTPAFVAVFRTRFRETHGARYTFLYPLVLALVTVVSFQQTVIPTLFLIFPLLVLI